MNYYRLWAGLAVVCVLTISGCATNTNRDDFDNDCDHARAYYEEMQQSVRTYYALGSTGVAEIAVAERKVKKAKEQVEIACGNNGKPDSPEKQ